MATNLSDLIRRARDDGLFSFQNSFGRETEFDPFGFSTTAQRDSFPPRDIFQNPEPFIFPEPEPPPLAPEPPPPPLVVEFEDEGGEDPTENDPFGQIDPNTEEPIDFSAPTTQSIDDRTTLGNLALASTILGLSPVISAGLGLADHLGSNLGTKGPLGELADVLGFERNQFGLNIFDELNPFDDRSPFDENPFDGPPTSDPTDIPDFFDEFEFDVALDQEAIDELDEGPTDEVGQAQAEEEAASTSGGPGASESTENEDTSGGSGGENEEDPGDEF